jgi:heat shock protein HtpX
MSTFKTMAGLTALTMLFLVVGRALGGQAGMVMALIFAAITNFVAYFFSDRIVLSMYGARKLEHGEAQDLHNLVGELSQNAGIPAPEIYMIPSGTPNAFATGRGPGHASVAVTQGLLELLSPREVRAVLAHEIGHVVNRDVLISTVVATLVGALGVLADMARWSVFFGGHRDNEEGGNPIALFVLALVMPLIGMLVQLFISRQREFGADETGAAISSDPLALASALEKLEYAAGRMPLQANPATAQMFIVNPLTAERIQSFFSTHPPTHERVARLNELAQEGIAAVR